MAKHGSAQSRHAPAEHNISQRGFKSTIKGGSRLYPVKLFFKRKERKMQKEKKIKSLFPALLSRQRKLTRIIGEKKDLSSDRPKFDHPQPQTSSHPAHQSRMGTAQVGRGKWEAAAVKLLVEK